ncbi:hypothetical protein V5799_019408 [Amblyomma americanum]|uniref:Uncharacterized protein n=1 Tax=Amblyomma americanum TaxID=6943 RepID=A0AAQ4EX22_AMBAM
MHNFILKYVRSLLACQRRKQQPHRAADELQALPYLPRPFDRIGIDFYCPLPYTAAGNRCAIVDIDHFTSFWCGRTACPLAWPHSVGTTKWHSRDTWFMARITSSCFNCP